MTAYFIIQPYIYVYLYSIMSVGTFGTNWLDYPITPTKNTSIFYTGVDGPFLFSTILASLLIIL